VKTQKFTEAIEGIGYGKRLPTALYILKPELGSLTSILEQTLHRAEKAARPDPNWNLLKLRTDQFAITFLSYPDFETNPHPSLTEATKINLNTGTVVKTDYAKRANPLARTELLPVYNHHNSDHLLSLLAREARQPQCGPHGSERHRSPQAADAAHRYRPHRI